jgi:hypothetical protein
MNPPALQFSPGLVRGTGSNYSVTLADYAFQPLHINIGLKLEKASSEELEYFYVVVWKAELD